MKIACALALGILAGFLAAVPARRAVIHYSEHSLPSPWTGPKIRIYHDGVQQVFDPAVQGWGAEVAI